MEVEMRRRFTECFFLFPLYPAASTPLGNLSALLPRLVSPTLLVAWLSFGAMAQLVQGQALSPAKTSAVGTQQPADHEGHDHEGHEHSGTGLSEEDVGEIVTPQTEEFKRASDALREHLKSMRAVMVNYHVSESPIEDREARERWPKLLAEGVKLHQAMMDAALVEFKSSPGERTDLAGMFARYLQRGYEQDRFDGMLPIGQALVENGYANIEIIRYMGITAFAVNEYEVAKPFLQKLVDEGEVGPELGMMIQNYDPVKAAWERELKQREQDAAGEPLPRVLLKTTKGNMEIELFEDQAPEAVANFIHLVEQGFYDNLTFHRVIEHFMAQTGCPQGDGMGGPGYFIRNEADKPEARNFFRGTLGMALAQERDTAGSQFFITFLPTPQLNGSFTAFGRVIEGIDTLSNINRINPEEKKEDKSAAPVMPDEIITIEILYKRDHEYKPSKLAE
jgi:cyclophilin family peptidyl-prolyl cis-trans isomerase